jgi:hypothetical protein
MAATSLPATITLSPHAALSPEFLSMTQSKVDFKRELREFYAPGVEPVMVDVPELAFLMIDGRGDPNTAPEFSHAIESLYTIAYAAKFALKRAAQGADYGVMPLEGLFWTADSEAFARESKSAWDWTLMIMQPDWVTSEVFREAQATALEKKPLEALRAVRLGRFAEGRAGQVLHIGPYAAEGPTIERLHAFIAEQGYALAGKHHEIYLGDPRRVAPEKLKTVIRRPIAARSA